MTPAAGRGPFLPSVADLESLVASASQPPGARSTDQWLALVAHCQEVVNVATAAQDAAMVRLAAIEREDAEDGTVVDDPRLPGHCALDAPDLVSGVLPVTHVHAQQRVALAVRLASDGSCDSVPRTGLGGLHEAMVAGVLDGYRASVVVTELHEVPADVAAAVVVALEPHLATDTPPDLRRRCRRVLAGISPDLLRQRARRAREECGLRRWTDEPGVDHWDGTFPSEDAALAWAAIDALAQRYVSDGTCTPIERARAKALTDLVAGQATIDITLGLTVPGDHVGAGDASTRTAGVAEAPAVGPPDDPAAEHTDGARERAEDAEAGARETTMPEPVGAGDVVVPTQGSQASTVADQMGPGPCPTDLVEGLVEVAGLVAGDPLLVSLDFIRRLLEGGADMEASSASTAVSSTSPAVSSTSPAVSGASRGNGARHLVAHMPCDPVTGALSDPGLSETGYRPSRRLTAFVRARDRRCRFPGCSVAARRCDLDHVWPWPAGPTSAANLMCLCRRHHRVKQRPGWRVRLAPDGAVTWVDPTGAVRVTHAVDALHGIMLGAALGLPVHGSRGAVPPEPSTPARQWWGTLGSDPHSAAEFLLEHVLAGRRDDDSVTARRHLRRRGVTSDRVPWWSSVTFEPLAPSHCTTGFVGVRRSRHVRTAAPAHSEARARAGWLGGLDPPF